MSALIASSDGVAAGAAFTILFIIFAVWVLVLIGYWKVFTKAGEEGWKAIIPIYNVYVMLRIAGRPGWWIVLFLIPFVNFVIMILVMIDLASSFGKGGGFAAGLILFAPIFLCILGFGDARYLGPAGPEGRSMQPGYAGGYGQPPAGGYGQPPAAPPPPPPPPPGA